MKEQRIEIINYLLNLKKESKYIILMTNLNLNNFKIKIITFNFLLKYINSYNFPYIEYEFHIFSEGTRKRSFFFNIKFGSIYNNVTSNELISKMDEVIISTGHYFD